MLQTGSRTTVGVSRLFVFLCCSLCAGFERRAPSLPPSVCSFMNCEYRWLPCAAPSIERRVHTDGSQFYCVSIVISCRPLHRLFEHFLLWLSLSTDPLNVGLSVLTWFTLRNRPLAFLFCLILCFLPGLNECDRNNILLGNILPGQFLTSENSLMLKKNLPH